MGSSITTRPLPLDILLTVVAEADLVRVSLIASASSDDKSGAIFLNGALVYLGEDGGGKLAILRILNLTKDLSTTLNLSIKSLISIL